MSFMQLQVIQKGALYSVDCSRCGCTMYTHEWVHDDHNDRRDAMQDGTLQCGECSRPVDPESFHDCGRQYAARYSAPGYLDCTEWNYGTNKRTLLRDIRAMYGE